jgi:hypothetical protein
MIDTPALVAALEAMDKLNSYARSEAYRNVLHCTPPKPYLYFLKRQMLKAVHESAKTVPGADYGQYVTWHHAIIAVPVTCRSCNGTGTWMDYNSYDDRSYPCRGCRAQGQRVLFFVESTFWHQWRTVCSWHTPVDDWPLPRPNCWPHETSWRPKQQGENLTPAEVAAALNTVETFLPILTLRRVSLSAEMRNLYQTYPLSVGKEERRCRFCGTGGEVTGYSCYRRRIQWTGYACRACADAIYAQPGKSVFDALPFPNELADDPAITAWRQRHETEPQDFCNDKNESEGSHAR